MNLQQWESSIPSAAPFRPSEDTVEGNGSR